MQHTLEFQHISKFFPGVRALDNISFKAYGGEVLAFLGENGAGKSTLLKTLNGDYQPNEGKYLLDGEEKHFKSPHEALMAGISVIYQERQILLELSVAENIFLGRMPVNGLGIIDTGKANQMAAEVIKDFGLPIKPQTKVKDLSIAYQQMVEIMKACSRENLKVICFDEPTASLSDEEIDVLFRIVKKLRDEGKIVIYVSHRMSELERITDKVAIFKDGKYVDTVVTKEVDQQQLIKMMVGRDLGDIYKNLDKDKEIGDVLLDVRDVSSDYVKPISGCFFRLCQADFLPASQGRGSRLLRPRRGRKNRDHEGDHRCGQEKERRGLSRGQKGGDTLAQGGDGPRYRTCSRGQKAAGNSYESERGREHQYISS